MDGVTRRYGDDGSTPRKSALGPDIRAQSSGECPGSSVTCRLGLFGLDECVGGGARPAGARPPDGPRFGTGPRARCAELAAGNCASVGGFGGGGIVDGCSGRGGGRMEVGLSGEIVKLGGGIADAGATSAFGVVGDSGSSIVGAGGDGRGGGGMSWISGTTGLAACRGLDGGVDGAIAGVSISPCSRGSDIVGISASVLDLD